MYHRLLQKLLMW